MTPPINGSSPTNPVDGDPIPGKQTSPPPPPRAETPDQAAERFEELDEPEDWATAQQKLALAHRGVGDLTRALAYIDTARDNGRFETPLQRVQIQTANGHILLTDPATRSEGHAVLDRASDLAARYGLKHQLRSINTVRNSKEYT